MHAGDTQGADDPNEIPEDHQTMIVTACITTFRCSRMSAIHLIMDQEINDVNVKSQQAHG